MININNGTKTPNDTAEESSSLAVALLKTVLITATILTLFIVFSAASVVGFGYLQLDSFSKSAGITKSSLAKLVQDGFTEEVIATDNKKNILILGLDQVENRQGDPLLTDTIMIVSIDTYTLETKLLSFPRDLWNDEYQTKINSLYHYGKERYPENPELFTTEVIMGMTGVPIHHTLVVKLDQVADIIDAVGGIEIDVPIGFTDTQFPRSDVDIRIETDPDILYQTIQFDQGQQTMNGMRALMYIRSRHSPGDQGTDDARAERQQQIISAIVEKVFSRDTITNPAKVGSLFKTYQDTFGENLPLTQLFAVARQVAQYDFDLAIAIHSDSLSVSSDQEQGVIMHPPISETQNQWSYVIVDRAQFKNEVWQKLNLNNQ